MSAATTVTFHSPTNNLRLVREQSQRKMNDQGQWDTIPGKAIEFRNGRHVTSDSGELSFLRSHPELGRLFHEQGAERDRERDNSAQIVAQITSLAIDGNAEAISDILLNERTTYSRPEVLGAAEAALNKLSGEVPAVPAAPEHELERVRSAPAVGPAVQPVSEEDRPIEVGPNQVPEGAVQPPPPAQVAQTPPPPATGQAEVVGPSPERQALEARARELGFTDDAIAVPDEQLSALVQQAEARQAAGQ